MVLAEAFLVEFVYVGIMRATITQHSRNIIASLWPLMMYVMMEISRFIPVFARVCNGRSPSNALLYPESKSVSKS